MKQISYIAIVLALAGMFFIGRQYANAISENERLRHNLAETVRENSELATALTVKDSELRELLQNKFPELEAKLDSLKIRSNTIEKIVVQKHFYKDTAVSKTDLRPVLDAIQKKAKIITPFVDSTACLVVKGYVEYNGERLNLAITNREFKSISEAVSHWERKQWKFWFIKSRLFGRKELKVTVFNNCGESKTIVVNKKR
tara:strand:+ start:3013 stop:3612 length:600 start_codon:yes stop_codon:yes gene_type:complete